MRRIVAFLTMVLTVVLSILLLSQPIAESIRLSNDFGQGTTLVYDITKRKDQANGAGTTIPGTNLTDININQLVMERLDSVGVRGAEVTLNNPQETVGSGFDSQTNLDGDNYQRLRVTIPQKSASELDNIKLVLENTGLLTVTDAENHAYTGTDFFASDTPAEVKYDAGKPYLLLHLKDDSTWQTFKKEAEGVQDTALQKQMFIWRNFDKNTDNYLAAYPAADSNLAPDSLVKSKIMFRDSTDTAYSADDVALKFTSYKDADDASHEWTIASAKAMASSINSTDYGFDISLAYVDESVAPTLGRDALRNTLIGFAVAYFLIFVILFFLYGWAGVVSLISNAAALTLSVMIFSLLGFEFSPAAVIGLSFTAILGVLINVNYFERIKNEVAKGRDILKANKEGYHKSFLLTLDLTAGSFLFALSAFFLTKDMTQVALGVVTIGSLLSFFVTNYLTKWMLYWLSTASNSLSKNKNSYFGLKPHKAGVPLYVVENVEDLPKVDTAKEKKSTKKKNLAGLLTIGILLLFGVLGLGITGGIRGGDNMFARSGSYQSQYRIDFMTTATGYIDSNASPRDFLTDTGINFTSYLHSSKAFGSVAEAYANNFPDQIASSAPLEGEGGKIEFYLSQNNLDFSVDNGEFKIETMQNDAQVLANSGDFKVVYASYYLSSVPSQESLAVLNTAMGTLVASSDYAPGNTNMSDAKGFQNETLRNRFEPSYRLIAGESRSSVVAHYESWFFAALALGVGILAIYVFIRFGLSAFLTTLGINVASLSAVLSLISVTGMAFSPLTAFGVIIGTLLGELLFILFFEKNAELLRSLKLRKTATDEQRSLIASLSLEASKHIGLIGISSILSATVFGMALFGTQGLMMMVSFSLTSLVALALAYLFGPSFYVFLRTHIHFKGAAERFERRRERRSKKPKKEIVADPDESKETVVPGINDYKVW